MVVRADGDPGVGCMAIPLAAVAGFVVGTLTVASLGASAGVSTFCGFVAAAVAVGVAFVVLNRTSGGAADE